ncbi:MAG: heat-shock protein Hsp20 [Parcubacteria group bacterium CG11_big_fil_rev_8_21_14_0_20_39_22]|nr:MAG: heat-shock protein Hsp20 [Parcubacteria group bacterium CG11_big_fil_rev_8_21_14_0_20_39_22]
MPKNKRSFFERLTGVIHEEDGAVMEETGNDSEEREEGLFDEEKEDGQLTVDVYQTPDNIVIKTIVAGVRPENLDISITRDMVTVRGSREETKEAEEEDYYHKELYWGSFSRSIVLPQEVDIEEAEAIEKNGLLIIKLPKLDKGKQTKLKVKSN